MTKQDLVNTLGAKGNVKGIFEHMLLYAPQRAEIHKQSEELSVLIELIFPVSPFSDKNTTALRILYKGSFWKDVTLEQVVSTVDTFCHEYIKNVVKPMSVMLQALVEKE